MTAGPFTTEDVARARARAILHRTDEAAVLRGYEELKREFGEELALELWGEVCRELDAEAEAEAAVSAERAILETLADVALVVGAARLGVLLGRPRYIVDDPAAVDALARLIERTLA